ncbi:hypothetical protein [Phaeobacter sp. B1627]|uniref:DUF7742 family protein n=1 Tax=Phaeobacter sp. B1627 TaxID=2583809 RepID=UPI0011193EA4|nr:hypothetical protein [Phaeobacter sp. B1627]TNJ46733.1 hypothetical protein FGE21_04725 [Phaeobacter sp. B1627]
MRQPVLWEDIRSLARALLAHPAPRRPELCRQILAGAARARRQARATGRCHPRWGDGSLGAAARWFPLAPEPFPGEPDYAACLCLALTASVAGAAWPRRCGSGSETARRPDEK